jgi:hypothetical protein
MKISSLAVLSVILLFGCTHNHIIKKDEPKDYQTPNQLAAKYRAYVIMTKGNYKIAEKLHIAPDTTSWIDPANQQAVMVPTRDICRIIFERPGKGAAEGLGIGAVSSAFTGIVFGYIFGYTREDDEDELFHTAEDRAIVGSVVFGVYGAVLGAGIGALAGALRGSRERYEIIISDNQEN